MQTKSLKRRMFWTWDHSMDWTPLTQGIQEWGASTPYCKKPGDFVLDYTNLIDFCAVHGFTGVIVYGFLRDGHGGIGAAQEVCRHGRAKNVAVIPGIGVNSYGGVYWEGKHEFNLLNWLDRHPELEAVGPTLARLNHYYRMACPSKAENRRFMLDSVRWLCETFDIGGINFETGDNGLCQCADCRKTSSQNRNWSPEDIVTLLPPLVEEAQKARPGILPVCECYFDSILDTAEHAPLRALPEGSVLQFSNRQHQYLKRFLNEMTPEKVAALPPHAKVLRTHVGSQWNDHRRKLVARDLSAMVKKVAEVGMDGVTLFGEVSATSVVNEINYLSVAAFADAPALTWDGFVARTLGPLFGGEGQAAKCIEFLEKTSVTAGDLLEAKAILHASDERSYRRWLWLVEHLYQRLTRT